MDEITHEMIHAIVSIRTEIMVVEKCLTNITVELDKLCTILSQQEEE